MKRLIHIVWPDVALLFILSMTVRLIHINHTPIYDEFYHILAAQSWLQEGSMRIAENGSYTRGALFTVIVAGMFKLVGASLVAARIPAVVAGSLWVAALYLWTRRTAGRTAGWAAALLLCFAPGVISSSEVARFYSLQGLCFLIGAAGFYFLLQEQGSRRAKFGVGAAAVMAFGAALHLQINTAIGLAGVALWIAVKVVFAVRQRTARRAAFVAVFVAVVCIAVLAASRSESLDRLLAASRWVALWNAGDSNNFRYYHYWFLDQYPTLWTLFPLAALIGLARQPAPAFFSVCVFGVSLILHSLAAAKEGRYLLYSIPFFFALWGIGIAQVLPAIRDQISTIVQQTLWTKPRRPVAISLSAALLAGALGFIIAANPAFPLTYRMLSAGDAGWPRPGYRGHPDWAAAADALKPLAAAADVVVASVSVKSLYYLGRCDVELRADNLFFGGFVAPEFTIDPRTGRPVISAPESLGRMMQRYPTGLVVMERADWRAPFAVPAAAADYLAAHANPVSLPETWGLVAYSWHRPKEAEVTQASDRSPPVSMED